MTAAGASPPLRHAPEYFRGCAVTLAGYEFGRINIDDVHRVACGAGVNKAAAAEHPVGAALYVIDEKFALRAVCEEPRGLVLFAVGALAVAVNRGYLPRPHYQFPGIPAGNGVGA